ncbi:hypothetical protein H0H87_003763 [Tephrocybe sp. NHM501043]|nr:hypothetical protein H0H87_003763 [Tephrocybe sp. NHM501043]
MREIRIDSISVPFNISFLLRLRCSAFTALFRYSINLESPGDLLLYLHQIPITTSLILFSIFPATSILLALAGVNPDSTSSTIHPALYLSLCNFLYMSTSKDKDLTLKVKGFKPNGKGVKLNDRNSKLPGGKSKPDLRKSSDSNPLLNDFFDYKFPTLIASPRHTTSTGTREPAYFDKHLDGNLRLRKVAYLPTLAAQFDDVADDALKTYLECHGTFPPVSKYFSTGRYLTQKWMGVGAHDIRDESSLQSIYASTIAQYSSCVAATLEFQLPVWAPGFLNWSTKDPHRVSGKAVADGFLTLEKVLDAEVTEDYKARIPPLSREYEKVSDTIRSIGIWEFKSLKAGKLAVFVAILDIANLKEFPWVSCEHDSLCVLNCQQHNSTRDAPHTTPRVYIKPGPSATSPIINSSATTSPPGIDVEVKYSDETHAVHILQQAERQLAIQDRIRRWDWVVMDCPLEPGAYKRTSPYVRASPFEPFRIRQRKFSEFYRIKARPYQNLTLEGIITVRGDIFDEKVVIKCARIEESAKQNLLAEARIYHVLHNAGVACIPVLIGFFRHANLEGCAETAEWMVMVLQNVGSSTVHEHKARKVMQDSEKDICIEGLRSIHAADVCLGVDNDFLRQIIIRKNGPPEFRIVFVGFKGAFRCTNDHQKKKEISKLRSLLEDPALKRKVSAVFYD